MPEIQVAWRSQLLVINDNDETYPVPGNQYLLERCVFQYLILPAGTLSLDIDGAIFWRDFNSDPAITFQRNVLINPGLLCSFGSILRATASSCSATGFFGGRTLRWEFND